MLFYKCNLQLYNVKKKEIFLWLNHLLKLKSYQKPLMKKKVLDNLSFTIAEGEIVKISGNNGSGKSTLLKIIARIYSQDSGQIKIKMKK